MDKYSPFLSPQRSEDAKRGQGGVIVKRSLTLEHSSSHDVGMKRLRSDQKQRVKELQALARHMRSNPTKGEIIVWNHLKAKRQGVQFRRQYVIQDWIVDFYCPTLKLIVEVDGDQHDPTQDQTRDTHLATEGITTHRIPSHQLFKPELRDQILHNLSTTIQELTVR